MSGLFSGVELAHRALDYHLERHNVLASNVANVETPGFHPLELVRNEEASGSGMRLAAARTDAQHLLPHHGLSADGYEVAEERVINPGNDDNAVSMERELSKIAANHLRYEGAARVVQMQLGRLRYVANDGSGG